MLKKTPAKDKKKVPAAKKKTAPKAAHKKVAAKKAAPKATAKPKTKPAAKKSAKPAAKKPAAKKAAPAKKVAAPAKKTAAVAKPVKPSVPAPKIPAAKPTPKSMAKPAPETPTRKLKTPPPKAPEVDDEASEADDNDEVVLTDAEGRRYCRVKDCDQVATVDGYCRFHYLLYWKKIQVRKKILSEGKLERYIEELTARYPDKFLDMLRKDLRSEKEFLAAIQELEIDESAVDGEFEDETANYIEEVRGMGDAGGGGRDEEDF